MVSTPVGEALLVAEPQLASGAAEAFADRVAGAVLCGHMVAGLAGARATRHETADWLRAHQPAEGSRV